MNGHHIFILALVMLSIIGMAVLKYGTNPTVLMSIVSGLIGLMAGMGIKEALSAGKKGKDGE